MRQGVFACLVELECLAALDCLQWLRTGSRAAEVLNCSQSRVSRNAGKCQKSFRVNLRKSSSEWCLSGDGFLLGMERRVHQQYRWDTDRPLRLDCQNWLGGTYSPVLLDGWIKGNLDYLEGLRPLSLLRDRVIDAWLCSFPDHPRDPEFSCFQLCSMPGYLVVKPNHPLLDLGSSVSFNDVRRYPVAPQPAGVMPVLESTLESMGLPMEDIRDAAAPSLPLADLQVGITSPLAFAGHRSGSVALPLTLPVVVGDVLVVRSDLAGHRRTLGLVDVLLHHLRAVSLGLNDVHVFAEASVLR
ncbi:hypothetical protein [Vulcanococcus limneticus]|uniref:hypothetical protein n=1 Tax=Vulcanococcus limneticus TaxID=2170428 RepID=UPI00398BD7A2